MRGLLRTWAGEPRHGRFARAGVVLLALLAIAGCAGGGRRMPPPSGPLQPVPGAALPPENAAGIPMLRIGIATALDTMSVACDETWRIALRGKARRPNRNDGGTRWTFAAEEGGVGVTDDRGRYRGAFDDTLRFYPDGEGAIRILGRTYRDTVEVFRAGDGHLTVVNVVDLEDYLRGVVAQEIGTGGTDALEAVKAQAVAARTYALSYVGRWKDLGFDLYGDVRDQVYLGIAGERERSDQAIAATRGVVALYEGAYIRANYSSTCGGHTASNDEVWDQAPLPFLRGRKDRDRCDEDFCKASPQYKWEETIPGDTFWRNFRTYKLSEAGNGESVREVRVKKRSESGRVRELLVKTSKREVVVVGDAIRWAVRRPLSGDPPLRSTLFDVKVEKRKGRVTNVILKGRGYGHGVGMCQMGALGMARAGYDYEKILRHYYQGIDLRALY